MHSFAQRVKFILVRPSHPGNIGAAARALKNMGWRRLVVVADTPPDIDKALPMATSAGDLVKSLEYHETLESALEGVGFAVATTSRTRTWQFPGYSARDLGEKLLPRAVNADVAILFGQENFGLSNDSIAMCQAIVEIDTAGMKSLNLAQAVLILSYELMMAAGTGGVGINLPEAPVELPSLDPVIKVWVEIWEAVEFMKGRNPKHFNANLRQILGRAALQPRELGLLRGFFNKVRHYFVRTGSLPPLPGEME